MWCLSHPPAPVFHKAGPWGQKGCRPLIIDYTSEKPWLFQDANSTDSEHIRCGPSEVKFAVYHPSQWFSLHLLFWGLLTFEFPFSFLSAHQGCKPVNSWYWHWRLSFQHSLAIINNFANGDKQMKVRNALWTFFRGGNKLKIIWILFRRYQNHKKSQILHFVYWHFESWHWVGFHFLSM